MDYSLAPLSTGFFQARILERIAFPSPGDLPKPGSFVRGILQAHWLPYFVCGGLVPKSRLILETPRTIEYWSGLHFLLQVTSQARNRTWVSFTAGEFFTDWATPLFCLCMYYWYGDFSSGIGWFVVFCFLNGTTLNLWFSTCFVFFFIQWCVWEYCHRGAYMSTLFFFTVT